MSSDTSHIQFSRHIWQAVGEQARRCLLSREFCPEQSKIDNLRCVHFEEEIESCYGRQLWYFEAVGVDNLARRQTLFGAMEFSVQYGLLEACQAALFEDADHRQKFLHAATQPIRSRIWDHAGTKFWVRITIVGVIAMLLLAGLRIGFHLTRPSQVKSANVTTPLKPSTTLNASPASSVAQPLTSAKPLS